MKRALVDGQDALDPDPIAIAGDGTVATPYQIRGLPFADAGDITNAPGSQLSDYTSCGGGQETGGEHAYEFTTTQTVAVRALVLGDQGHDGCTYPTCANVKDYGLHVFAGGASSMAHCKKTNNTMLEGTLAPGTYQFVVDHYANGPKSKNFVFSLMACHAGDPACANPF